ncbi:uncharacterized protein [Macrobrachium rosenbergii]|uniref:uncharacterized protein n=1 Tax=Macrobrachium rosenbergii TaxID=79674 RepID=UPI0034D45483
MMIRIMNTAVISLITVGIPAVISPTVTTVEITVMFLPTTMARLMNIIMTTVTPLVLKTTVNNSKGNMTTTMMKRQTSSMAMNTAKITIVRMMMMMILMKMMMMTMDDYDDEDEGHGQPSHHHHHLITGQNGASIEVDDDGKVYMFLKVNETFDPSKYYLEVGNNTKLLLDLGEAHGNDTTDYEFVKRTNPGAEEKEVKGTAGGVTLMNRLSANTKNVQGTKEQSVVLLNVADLPEDREGSNKSITNKNSARNNEAATFSVKGKGDNAVTTSTEIHGTALKSQENKMPTVIPRLPNDTHISVGWSSATVSDESTTEPPLGKMSHENGSGHLVSRTPSSDGLPHLTTTISYLDGLEEYDDGLMEYDHEEEHSHDEGGGHERGDDQKVGGARDKNDHGEEDTHKEEGDLDEEEEVIKSILDMDDNELKTFLASNPDLIESDNDEYEANATEPEMTTSALMLDPHRDVIENFNGSESSFASQHAHLDEEEPTETEPEDGDLTWFLIPSESVNQTAKTSVNNTGIDYGQIYLELMAANNLTDEERLELGDLERLRRATETLGGLGTLREDQTKHHVVRRQLKGTEACGSFSRRRRDTGSTDKVNTEGHRYKRGVSNLGRRLEMGNPAFSQLYNQYKNMCNFIAMVAFEK